MSITNTSKQDPILNLLTAHAGGIEAQEAAGQRELCNSKMLPTEGSEDPRWALIGITFEKPTDEDPLFRKANLPPGWKIVATSHDMWSNLVDGKGRGRAGIFYKAAFYDRRASIRLDDRFSYGQDYSEEFSKAKQLVFSVKDSGTVIYSSGPVGPLYINYKDKTAYEERLRLEEEWKEKLKTWLEENRPGWDDYLKSWELP